MSTCSPYARLSPRRTTLRHRPSHLLHATLIHRRLIPGDEADIQIEELGPDKHGEVLKTCNVHAVIKYDKPHGHLTLRDTSGNKGSPVCINGKALHLGVESELCIGDKVSIAGYCFEVLIRTAEVAASPPDAATAAATVIDRARRRGDAGHIGRMGPAGAAAGGMYMFTPGQEVEVSSYEDGYRGAWFAGVVKRVETRMSVPMVLVEYKEIQAGEDPKDGMLTEWVPCHNDFRYENPAKRGKSNVHGKRKSVAVDEVEEAAREAAEMAAKAAPIIQEYPGHIISRYRIRPASRPAGYRVGDEPHVWPNGSFVEAPYCDAMWSGHVISTGEQKERTQKGDIQVAFLKQPVGEGGYGHYAAKDLRRALEWQMGRWFDNTTEQTFPAEG